MDLKALRALPHRTPRLSLARLRRGSKAAIVALPIIAVALIMPAWAAVDTGGFQIDGDLFANTPPAHTGTLDWNNVTNFQFKNDLLTGKTDDALGQGTKEDNPTPTVVFGSIPNNKSDLSHFMLAQGTSTVGSATHNLLYLGWERNNTLGTANMDFELNQTAPATVPPAGGTWNLNRTAGDRLVTFDFAQGGNTVNLGMLTWLTSNVSGCFASNALPCWGNRVDLTASQEATGSVNDPNIAASGVAIPTVNLSSTSPNPNVVTNTATENAWTPMLAADTFGEAAVDLTAAGVFTSNCSTFGSAYLKSRASTSFGAELKDFIAPLSTTITNCGSLIIHKTGQIGSGATSPLGGAVFTLYNDNAPVGTYNPGTDTATAMTCTTATTTGDCQISNIPPGNYVVVETTTPPGYATASPQPVTITASTTPLGVTFNDVAAPTPIHITKTDDVSPTGAPVDGAVFTLYNDNGPGGTNTITSNTCTTVAGTCNFTSDVVPGNYCVAETTTPTGYATVAQQCFSISLGQSTKNLIFVNPRLFKIIVLVCNDATGQLYPSSVTLPNSDGTSATKQSLGPNGGLPTTDATLCALGGAAFDNLQVGPAGTTFPGSVFIPNHQ